MSSCSSVAVRAEHRKPDEQELIPNGVTTAATPTGRSPFRYRRPKTLLPLRPPASLREALRAGLCVPGRRSL